MEKNSYFGSQACDFSIEKGNMHENTIFYVNQDYLSHKDNDKVYHNDLFIIGQITPSFKSAWRCFWLCARRRRNKDVEA